MRLESSKTPSIELLAHATPRELTCIISLTDTSDTHWGEYCDPISQMGRSAKSGSVTQLVKPGPERRGISEATHSCNHYMGEGRVSVC